MCSPPAYTKSLTKVYGPNCTTETTSIEIETTTCKEEVLNGKQKFDPDKNAGDALLYEATQLMMYSVFVKLITEMN